MTAVLVVYAWAAITVALVLCAWGDGFVAWKVARLAVMWPLVPVVAAVGLGHRAAQRLVRALVRPMAVLDDIGWTPQREHSVRAVARINWTARAYRVKQRGEP